MEYFTSQKVSDNITAVKSLSGEIMYLIEGETGAVLIDTCVGIKGLRDFIETLTDKPITVLLSHGHLDHAMGASEFDRVYMNPRDLPLYRTQNSKADRIGYIKASLKPGSPFTVTDDMLIEAPDGSGFDALGEGMDFDLGSVKVTPYSFPGHTQGETVFVVEPDRVLVMGDACNNFTFLFDGENSSSVEDYRNTVAELETKLAGKYDRVFLMHHLLEAPPDIFGQMRELCDEVLDGQTDDIPFAFLGVKDVGRIARHLNDNFQRDDGVFANLVYNPDKIRNS